MQVQVQAEAKWRHGLPRRLLLHLHAHPAETMCEELKGQSNLWLLQGQVSVQGELVQEELMVQVESVAQEESMVQGELVVHENFAMEVLETSEPVHENLVMEVLEVLKLVNEMVQMLQCAQVLSKEHLLPSLLEVWVHGVGQLLEEE